MLEKGFRGLGTCRRLEEEDVVVWLLMEAFGNLKGFGSWLDGRGGSMSKDDYRGGGYKTWRSESVGHIAGIGHIGSMTR